MQMQRKTRKRIQEARIEMVKIRAEKIILIIEITAKAITLRLHEFLK